MMLRDEIEKRIDRKEAEIRELEVRIREAKAYIQSLSDTLRLLPKDASADATLVLRPGTALARVREAIGSAGRPLHIGEILKALGRPVDKKNRAALSGTLAAYVRKGQVFTRPAPNTFGLVELSQHPVEKAEKETGTFAAEDRTESAPDRQAVSL